MQLLLKLSLLIRWHIPSSTQQLQVSESYRNTQHLDWSNNSNFYYQNDQDQPLYLIDWSCPTKDKVNTSLDVTLVKVVCSKQIHEPKGLSDSSQIAGMIMKNKFPIFLVHNIPAKYMIDNCWLYWKWFVQCLVRHGISDAYDLKIVTTTYLLNNNQV